MRKIFFTTFVVLFIGAGIFIATRPSGPQAEPPGNGNGEQPPVAPPDPAMSSDAKYLAFQLTTGSPQQGILPLTGPASRSEIESMVKNISRTIGVTDTAENKLAFMVGPLSLDYADAELRRIVQDAFAIAEVNNVAVGFHIDDSMFWSRKKDLWQKKQNVEWLDWNGTANTGRKLVWGADPLKLAPQMCMNSIEVRNELQRVGTEVIGSEIKKGIDSLKAKGKGDLFAGVIAGWETQIARDFDTNKPLGYCALTNKGFSASNPPSDPDAERGKIVQEFIEFWAKAIADAGVDAKKIYSHTAFIPLKEYRQSGVRDSYAVTANFAPISASFGVFHNAGFSTYPAAGIFEELYAELKKRGNPAWASSEGTNAAIGSASGEDTMETYLARMFNHGATLVNIFAWGVGGEAGKNIPFRVATENPEAIRAYQKFLRGEPLRESPIPAGYGLSFKVDRIQLWVRSGGDQKKIALLFDKMMQFIQQQNPTEAEKVADQILELVR